MVELSQKVKVKLLFNFEGWNNEHRLGQGEEKADSIGQNKLETLEEKF